MPADSQASLRSHLLELLDGASAHASFDDTVKGFPPELRGAKLPGAPHSASELLGHLRLAQWDILEFSRDAKHQSPAWPEGYWPHEMNWDESAALFQRDLDAFKALVADPEIDLLAPIPHAPDGQTLLREALLLADHNSYHLGQIMFIRRALGA